LTNPFHLQFVEADGVGVRLAPHGYQQRLGLHVLALAVGECGAQSDAVLRSGDVLGFGAGLAADAGFLEIALQLFGNLFVFHRNQARQHFEDRDLGSEAVENRGKLHAHRARADNQHGLGNRRQVENFDVGQDRLGVRLQAGKHARFRSGGDDHILRLQGLSTGFGLHFHFDWPGAGPGQDGPVALHPVHLVLLH